jgi:hypothetical protein
LVILAHRVLEVFRVLLVPQPLRLKVHEDLRVYKVVVALKVCKVHPVSNQAYKVFRVFKDKLVEPVVLKVR